MSHLNPLALGAALLCIPSVAAFGTLGKKPDPKDEYACRAIPVFETVDMEGQLQRCIEAAENHAGLWTPERCKAEAARLVAQDTVGCGPPPPPSRNPYSLGEMQAAPSELCNCCRDVVGASTHKATLCADPSIGDICADTCTGAGVDEMLTVAMRITLDVYIEALDADPNALAPASLCEAAGQRLGWPCAGGGRRLAAAPQNANPSRWLTLPEDAPPHVVATFGTMHGLAIKTCEDVQGEGMCKVPGVEEICAKTCLAHKELTEAIHGRGLEKCLDGR